MQVLVDQRPGLGCRRTHHALDDIGGKLFHHVDGIVDEQFLDDARQFRVGHGVDDPLLIRGLEIRKNIGCRLLGEETEDHRHAVVLNAGEKLGHVELVHLFHALLQRAHVAAVQEVRQLVRPLFLKGIIIQGIQGVPVLVLIHLCHPPLRSYKQDILS